jgi:hypothetical protein
MADPVTIQLSRPLNVIGTDRTSLDLREPTGKDITAAGYPIRFTDAGTEVDAKSMSRLIAQVASVPAANIDMLPACDWQQACLALMGFFAPQERTEPS